MLRAHQWMQFCFQQLSNLSCLIKSGAPWPASLFFSLSPSFKFLFWLLSNIFIKVFLLLCCNVLFYASVCACSASCSCWWSAPLQPFLNVPARFIIDKMFLSTRPLGSQLRLWGWWKLNQETNKPAGTNSWNVAMKTKPRQINLEQANHMKRKESKAYCLSFKPQQGTCLTLSLM